MFWNILGRRILGNRVRDYLAALFIFILGYILLEILKRVFVPRWKKRAEETSTTLDDLLIQILGKTVIPLCFLGLFYISVKSLLLNAAISRFIDVAGIAVLTFFGVKILGTILEYAIRNIWGKKGEVGVRESKIKGVLPAVWVVLWALGLVFLMENLGFRINTVIAGLGIGGIALALASQAVLGDLFSYFCILLDSPFEVGDFLIVNEYMGNVENIGIKTTRIRSLGGEQLVFSNTDLTGARIQNYKRMNRRRIVFKFGVVYNTPIEKLKQIPACVKGIIESIPETTFDRVHFSSFGDFSLIYEVVYYVENSDYNKYMNTQQSINLALVEEMEKLGVEFAFPTQTLYFHKIESTVE